MNGNGQPPEGYRAPVRQALTRKHLIKGVPREWLFCSGLFLAGIGLLFDTWGVVPVFLVVYWRMRVMTKRDPWWPEVWRDCLHLWIALHPAEWVVLRVILMVGFGVLLLSVFVL